MRGPRPRVAVLGGGPAGLAAAYHARRRGFDWQLYEAAPSAGGNCRTLRFGDFLVDTGAHRLHDRDEETTAIARELLGDDLLHVDAPSRLHHDGRLLDFPLAPLDLLRRLPFGTLASIARENIALRTSGSRPGGESFGDVARSTYGETLASLALLNYSRKLWGRDPDELVPAIAGSRLARLDLRTFLVESFRGRSSARRHLDGSFLYPRHGIGELFERMTDSLGDGVRTGAAVHRIVRDRLRVTGVEVEGIGLVEPATVINTLPLGLTARLLTPAPPEEILESVEAITFRQLRLCVITLGRDRFSPNASIYFPDPDIPFTRLYEPKNRSAAMAPKGATSIVLETPCERGDRLWNLDSDRFRGEMVGALREVMNLPTEEIIATHDVAIPNAYPVLSIAAAASAAGLLAYFDRFENMKLVGRNARFVYSSIHDMFVMARRAVQGL